ncbi:GNAT family N-acetyltransferase [Acrocarpospora phusangensis]|uniref:GNAT family N-acetyltransferase n=1 Tax=Acrocarpospora phusangensis TaxID=1070424 RepID=UPI001EF17053|nr:GNAT family N-acetyltransferase [Acrocarpospora phusangensis]
MSHAIFRPARREDVPAIVALLNDDAVARSRGIGHGIGPELWTAFAAIDADPNNELFVAELDGELVGTWQLTFIPGLSRNGGERAQIEAVRVAESHRNQGIGRAMVTWSVERAKARGCKLVQLTTDKRRADAHRFYASLGFTATHEGFKLALP